MQLTLLVSSLGCKFCHAPPLYIIDYNGQTYYVVHKLQSLSRAVIHLGVNIHLIVDEKCKESLDETKRLITKEVVCTLNAKTFAIPFNASKTFLAKHLLDDCNDGTVELLKGE
jgi:hypothetical protein